jgi:hypothetical protein
MTKSPKKLALRKETLRQLSNKELAHAVGGGDPAAALAQSDPKECNLALPLK